MFARARIRGVRPIDIGRRLVAAMDDLAQENANVLPASWRIRLNPSDLEELAHIRTALVHELTVTVTNHAVLEGYSLRGNAAIDLRPDPAVPSNECQLEPAAFSVSQGTAPVEPRIGAGVAPPATSPNGEDTNASVTPTSTPPTPTPPTSTPPRLGVWVLVATNGARFVLEGDVATIGRQAGSSIHISDSNVSRLHAEMRKVAGSWTIEDRGSTNGTRINGTMIVDPSPLSDGDVIALGAVELRVERG